MDFSDFTVEKYTGFLKQISDNYKTIFFDEIDFEGASQFLLRHDVDYSLEHSLVLAQQEASLGLRSTFFVQVTCDFYNPFSSRSIAIVKKIIELGHAIGIHVDSHTMQLEERSDLEKQLNFDKELFFKYYGADVKVFSFHNPNEKLLAIEDYKINGLVNTYSKKIQEQFQYCSDSNGYWRFKSIGEVLVEEPKNIQFLSHPAWWCEKVLPPRQRIEAYLDAQKAVILKDYDETLEASGRTNYR